MQLSADAKADPIDDAALATKLETVLRGETLRGLLLSAYAFDTADTIAGIAAMCAFFAALVMAVLAGFEHWHSRRVAPTETVFGP